MTRTSHLCGRAGRSLLPWLAALATIGCAGWPPRADERPPMAFRPSAATPERPPERARPAPRTITVRLPQTDPLTDEALALAARVTADPNTRPVRVWAVGSASGVRRLYLVGHADPWCCQRASAVLSEVANGLEGGDIWLGFGLSRLDVGEGDGAGLAVGVERLEALAAEDVCRGQIEIQRLDRDLIEDGAEAQRALAIRALDTARALDRPLMLWSAAPAQPMLTPVLAIGPDGAVAPLELTLPMASLAIPGALRGEALDASRAAAGEALTAVERRIAELRAHRSALARVTPVQIAGLGRSASRATPGSAEAADLERRLAENHRNLKRVVAEGARRCRAFDQLGRSDLGWTALQQRALRRDADLCRRQMAFAERVLADTEADLRALRTPGADRARVQTHGSTVRLGEPVDDAATAELRAGIDQLLAVHLGERARLSEAVWRMNGLLMQLPAETDALLVDAMLRGWPATYDAAEPQAAFDAWAVATHPRAWAAIRADLGARGIDLGEAPGPGVLRGSATLFRVRIADGVARITPHVVLGADHFVVVDPAARLIRYESAIDDQNLADVVPGRLRSAPWPDAAGVHGPERSP